MANEKEMDVFIETMGRFTRTSTAAIVLTAFVAVLALYEATKKK